jgi:hypothetical protein
MSLPRGSHEPQLLLQAYDIRSLVVTDQGEVGVLWETGPEETAGGLTLCGPDGHAVTQRQGLRSPQGLWVTADKVYWTETRPPRVALVPQVPIAASVHVILSAARGQGPASLVALAAGGTPHFAGQLLGVRDGKLYYTEPIQWGSLSASTCIRRGAGTGDTPDTLARAATRSLGALDGSRLYWTAPSEELNAPDSGRIVQRLDLATDDGAAVTITDWLPSMGFLSARGGRTWYVGGGHLWRVHGALAPPIPVNRTSTFEPGQAYLQGGNVYVYEVGKGGPAIMRRPLSVAGYLTTALPAFGQRQMNPIQIGGGAG